jgi:hypothetical protein
MPLIVLHDAKSNRDRIINTDNIFHCVEVEDGVRVHYTEGSIGRGHVIVAGSLADFAKSVGAKKVG